MQKFIISAPIIALLLFNSPCSNEASDCSSSLVDNCFFVKQGSGQCGPTSFYMIFKYYGDHRYKGEFRELPECKEIIPLQQDLDEVTKESAVSVWLGVTNSGIKIELLFEKISKLGHGNCTPYYSVQGNTNDDVTDKTTVFNTINNNFLKHSRPVILHLKRPEWAGMQLFSGHYIVLKGYDEKSRLVCYVDPNKNDKDPVVQTVPLQDFINTNWYHSPDYSFTCPVPDAYWDGTWIGFYHAE